MVDRSNKTLRGLLPQKSKLTNFSKKMFTNGTSKPNTPNKDRFGNGTLKGDQIPAGLDYSQDQAISEADVLNLVSVQDSVTVAEAQAMIDDAIDAGLTLDAVTAEGLAEILNNMPQFFTSKPGSKNLFETGTFVPGTYNVNIETGYVWDLEQLVVDSLVARGVTVLDGVGSQFLGMFGVQITQCSLRCSSYNIGHSPSTVDADINVYASNNGSALPQFIFKDVLDLSGGTSLHRIGNPIASGNIITWSSSSERKMFLRAVTPDATGLEYLYVTPIITFKMVPAW